MKRKTLQLAAICSLAFALNSSAAVLYVDLNSTNPLPPYADWSTAATNIQDAVDAANPSDQILVTNGVYQEVGDGANRVTVNKAITVQSVNGPAATVIDGAGAMRCVNLANGAVLAGFTLTNGFTSGYGGGVCCQYSSATVSNCVLIGNSATYGGGAAGGTLINCTISGNVVAAGGAAAGGGVYGYGSTGYNCWLYNCTLTDNSATGNGGGGFFATYNNCTITGNSSQAGGGGVAFGVLNNCTIVGNYARLSGGGAYGGTLTNCIIYYNAIGSPTVFTNTASAVINFCCTTPPYFGSGNITNAPGFVDLAGGNLRLQIGSPCINAGTNAFAPVGPDLDGNPRIVNGTVDMGAYENQYQGTVHYVRPGSATPVPPYTNWATAAIYIQDAVNVALAGELVVADAGFYSGGNTIIYGQEANCVALTNAVTLLSVYGPQATSIVGGWQTRCVYVGSNAILSGFTVTNGQTRLSGDLIREQSGGGIWCEPCGSVANCLVISNFAGNRNNFQSSRLGGGIYGGAISNCVLTGNFSGSGGGAAAGTLWNCTLTNNTANQGGGTYRAALYNSVLSSNAAIYNGFNGSGGGVYQCTLYGSTLMGNQASGNGAGTYQGINYYCLIAGNAANSGGGTYQSTNYGCTISDNAASNGGGGDYGGLLYNCVLSGNTATNSNFKVNGGGGYSSTIINCTVTGNSASGVGGGIYGGGAFNSIIYFNSAPGGGANWTNNPYMNYCCTAPAFFNGFGNITNDPSFVDAMGGDFRLKCGSPCIDAGVPYCSSPLGVIYAPTNDIRGVLRPLDGNGDGIAQYDIGAYEYNPAIDPIPVVHALFAFTNFAANYPVSFAGEIGGCADYFWWDFGDGVTITNQSPVSHAWASPGQYNVRLSAYYSTLGQSLTATTQVQVVQQPVYYADLNSPMPTFPYTNWTTAARNIQDAVGAGITPGRLVLVTDGVYQSQGVIVYGNEYNSVALTNPVVVQSANGPGATTIQGYQGRCAYVGSNAILSGFTLTGGRAANSGDICKELSGGGVWCEPGGVVSNCVVTWNQAAYYGGGAYQGTFYNCVFTNNWLLAAPAQGGGVFGGTLYNCTIISNSAPTVFAAGGGVSQSTLYNCILTGNSANYYGNGGGANLSTLYNCTVSGNLTWFYGGGANLSTLYNCTVSGNSAAYGGGGNSNTIWNCMLTGNIAGNGGGAYASTLHNCLVASNQASSNGGGIYSGTLYNCTVVNNTAANGGGFYQNSPSSMVYNSIIYDNTATNSGNNWQGFFFSNFSYNCCSLPLMGPAFYGNISNDPMFMDAAFHLSAASPCCGAGNPLYATGMDLDGEAWNNPPSMGADEVYDADFIGALSVAIQSPETNLLVNHSLALTGQISGRAAGLEWSFGDGTIVSNVSYFISHAWTNTGDYSVIFTAYNTDNPGGVSTNLLVHVLPLVQPWLEPSSFSISSTGNFQFQFNGQADAIYTVQVATNLIPPIVWQDLETITSTGCVVQVTDPNAPNGMSFYRVSVQ
jgi:parallel beta-helix repeat protein